jgi:hypothetical protein
MVAIALLLGSAGCGSDDGQPERPVRATLDLEVEAAGPPDAGERAGHGGIYMAAAKGPRVTFTGRATPRDAEVKVTGARANVRIDESGRFHVQLDGLRRGATDIRLHVTSPDGAAWVRRVRVVRTGSP